MGLKSWLRSKLGMAEWEAEEAGRLRTWEFAQANDWELLDADPLAEEVKAAFRLSDASPDAEFERLRDLAEKGSPFSMKHVAWRLAVGSGVGQDRDAAQAWFRRAFEAGSDRALLEYGAALASRGQIAEAEKVYEAGWRRGFVPAVYRLIRLRLTPSLPAQDRLAWKAALEWAAEAGHPGARHLLAKYLLRGRFGVRGVPRGVRLACAQLAAIARNDPDRPVVG